MLISVVAVGDVFLAKQLEVSGPTQPASRYIFVKAKCQEWHYAGNNSWERVQHGWYGMGLVFHMFTVLQATSRTVRSERKVNYQILPCYFSTLKSKLLFLLPQQRQFARTEWDGALRANVNNYLVIGSGNAIPCVLKLVSGSSRKNGGKSRNKGHYKGKFQQPPQHNYSILFFDIIVVQLQFCPMYLAPPRCL